MKRMNRRNFIKTGVFGMAGMSVLQSGGANISLPIARNTMIDSVKLGESGLIIPRMAMGSSYGHG